MGWRGTHYYTEGGREIPPKMPSVIPAIDSRSVEMTRDIQLMSFDLMRAIWAQRGDPAVITGKRWVALHGAAVAMNNGAQNGYGVDRNGAEIPHTDYVSAYPNVINPTASNPQYDKNRTFQGSFLTGRQEGAYLICTPGNDAIDANGFHYEPGTAEARKTLQDIIERRWFCIAIGAANPPYHFRAQWGAGWIVYPFILNKVVRFDVSFFARWEESYPPDPLTTYRKTV